MPSDTYPILMLIHRFCLYSSEMQYHGNLTRCLSPSQTKSYAATRKPQAALDDAAQDLFWEAKPYDEPKFLIAM